MKVYSWLGKPKAVVHSYTPLYQQRLLVYALTCGSKAASLDVWSSHRHSYPSRHCTAMAHASYTMALVFSLLLDEVACLQTLVLCTLNCNRSRRGGMLLWIPCKAWPCTSFDFVWKSLPITEVSCISLYSQPMSYRGSVCTTQAQSQAAQGTPCSGTALILYQVTETAHYTHMYLPKNNIHYNENIMFWRKWIITE